MKIETFFDPATWTLTYVVYDEETRDAVVIDPVLDYDPLAVSTNTASNERVASFLDEHELTLHAILETHAHADHLSGSQWLKERYGAPVMIGEHIQTVQETFKGVFNLPEPFKTDGSQFERLVRDGETLDAGSLKIKVIHTPGHTPACVSYLIDDAVFTGDALFMPDFGTGRCDFPAGSAEDLYESIHEKLYHLPDETRVFVGHDYMPNGRELKFETTIGESKQKNIQLPAGRSREDFVKFRSERDKTLRPPNLIFQSVQVNIDAGHLPEADTNGIRYLRMPMNIFG
ncbi:MAG: MBL fold metallo-hydrolase [Deltaproteobacteria bacterium]|nr:MAG: MBL fold metallo-hydrolase [Deltaproteobacteria bacterium]